MADAETITHLCDRLDSINRRCHEALRLPTEAHRARLVEIEELSAGFMSIPPCAACGQRHAEPECEEREP